MTQVQAPAPTTPTIRPMDRTAVYTRTAWDKEWEIEKYLRPTGRGVLRSAPGFSRFEFRHDYGDILREDGQQFDAYFPWDLTDRYVQVRAITAAGTLNLFTGVITDEELDVEGETSDHNPSGAQTLRAYGMEYRLSRQYIRKSYCRQVGEVKAIDRVLPFNLRHARGGSLLGNRSEVKWDGVYAFAADGETWTHYDIAEYLLDHFHPPGITFRLAGQASLLEKHKTTVRLGCGQDLYSALCQLIDRRRGLGFYLDPEYGKDEDGNDIVGVMVYSLVGDTVIVGDQQIDKNTDQHTIDLDDRVDIAAHLGRSTSAQFDKIIVRGLPVKVCCTVSYQDGTLEEAWSETEEYEYQSGSGRTGADKDEHDAERKTDRFERVYQSHRIPRDWDWQAADGTGGVKKPANPSFDSEGHITDPVVPAPYFNFSRSFLNWLPLPAPADADDAEPEFRKPLVIVQDKDSIWRQVDGIPASDKSTLKCQVRMASREMMIHVIPPGGNHVFAKNHWDPGAADTDIDLSEEIDYETMIATVAMETDVVLSVEHTIRDGGTRTLVIEVDDAELWYVVPGTIVGVEDGDLVEFDPANFPDYITGNIVRDDSDRLRAIAAFAAAWYGQERAAATIRINGLRRDLRLGSYIREGTSAWMTQQIGTVVTSINWDFGQDATTTYQTSYAEIDADAISAGARLADERTRAAELRDTQRTLGEIRSELGHFSVRVPRLPFDRGPVELIGATVTEWASSYVYDLNVTRKERTFIGSVKYGNTKISIPKADLVFNIRYPTVYGWYSFLLRSEDCGENWTSTNFKTLAASLPIGMYGNNQQTHIGLPSGPADGKMYCALWYPWGKYNPWSTSYTLMIDRGYLAVSSDDGVTWSIDSTVAALIGDNSILGHDLNIPATGPDGSIAIMMRAPIPASPHYYTMSVLRSLDYGSTWSVIPLPSSIQIQIESYYEGIIRVPWIKLSRDDADCMCVLWCPDKIAYTDDGGSMWNTFSPGYYRIAGFDYLADGRLLVAVGKTSAVPSDLLFFVLTDGVWGHVSTIQYGYCRDNKSSRTTDILVSRAHKNYVFVCRYDDVLGTQSALYYHRKSAIGDDGWIGYRGSLGSISNIEENIT